jgi:hypothetical protein
VSKSRRKIGGNVARMEETRNVYKTLVGKYLKRRDELGDLGVGVMLGK